MGAVIGTLSVVATELGENKEWAYINFNATNLDKKDTFGKAS
jgi:hypothetical protein